MRAPAAAGPSNGESARALPAASRRQSANRCAPSPVRAVDVRKRAGMIWSVSTSSRGRTTTRDASVVNGLIGSGSVEELARVGDRAGDRGRRRGERAGEEGAAAGTLTALEVAVARAHGVLAAA